jgi:Glyoxalase-like domain
MALKWYTTVIDCQDLHAQARWWAGVLDWQIVYEAEDQAAIVPRHEEDRPLSAEEWPTVGPALVFVPVSEGKIMKNRLHLDLAPHITDDRDALIDSLLARGATRASVGQDESEASWTVLADPEGNEFCVLSARDS